MVTGVDSLYTRLALPGAAATDHERSKSIDAVRATAAVMVVVAHAYLLAGAAVPPAGEGSRLPNGFAAGVWLFFATSGFLIAGPFLRSLLQGGPLPPVRSYAVRRASRILPAYWFALAAILLLVSGAAVAHAWQLPVHALLLHALVPEESQRLFFVAWTLGYEAIFYALVPLGAVLIRRAAGSRPMSIDHLGAALAGLWLLSVLWGLALVAVGPLQENGVMRPLFTVLFVPVGLGNFCPGLLVFLASTPQALDRGGPWRAYRRLVARPWLLVAITVACWAVTVQLLHSTAMTAFVLFHPLVGVASGLILATAVSRRWSPGLTRLLAPIGLVSYGLYLWHWVVLQTLRDRGLLPFESVSVLAWAGNVAVLLALAVPLALASWVLVERPLMRRTTMWDRARSGGRAAPAPREEAVRLLGP